MVDTQQTSLFEKLGGEPAFEMAVDIFYKKVLSDELVNEFFVETNMAEQKKHQKNFLMLACGGPNYYKGRDLRTAHMRLSLDDNHFDAIIGHLASTLKELTVSEDLIKIVVDRIETLRPDILNR